MAQSTSHCRCPYGLPHQTQGNSKYAFYHKTDWATVPKIPSEGMIRPADWTKDSKGLPNQFPSYGPFGMATKVGSVHDPMNSYAADQLSNGLFRIGKGQGSSGFSNVFR